MSNNELMKIYGGGINASLINSVARLFNVVLNIGRNIGSALNYFNNGRSC